MDSDEEVDSAIGQPVTATFGEVAAASLQPLTQKAPETVATPLQEPNAIIPLGRLGPPQSAGSEDVDMDDRSDGDINDGSGLLTAHPSAGGTQLGEQGVQTSSAPTGSSGALEEAALEDVDMTDSSGGAMPEQAGGSSGDQQLLTYGTGPFAAVYSPSSETDPSQEPYWHTASQVSSAPGAPDEIVGATASSTDQGEESDGYELEKVVPPSRTYNLDYKAWIGSVHGAPISVPANGQCLCLAFYATTTNTQAKKLTLRATTVAAADLVKQRVLDIVLANLRYDVKLRLILPKEELLRIYPGEQPPYSQEAAAAMLYAHYVKMREVSVATSVPQVFWEEPTVVRAMAVYLREPIYVWDVDAADRAYVQQYSYKKFEMDNGDRHDTGIVAPHSEDRIRDILEACFHQKVVPTMLLLKHTEGHFYGVQHGDVFHEWHAHPGPDMRERLDHVHRLVGLPVLPSARSDPESVAAEATYEEQALLEEMGVTFMPAGPKPALCRSQRIHLLSALALIPMLMFIVASMNAFSGTPISTPVTLLTADW
ncbi:hypothetical protein PF005_g19624 [Phytophthora fragariae]|nr:hypothetical protein PF003_g6175 [Phytophthora fragariae]KAE8929852.1 hypothetical protein PF009_g20041 [Phytophthora fragariae]KAE9002177.1 hypothetical protein PF011_g13432 [Phytophthora fragariae]KAE9090627.1 hypothetical protein PF007_g19168 [Phytophthora fragariae]KAE9120825.1 hypothetical protein PF006_g18035 [Phytophthora fragariae]